MSTKAVLKLARGHTLSAKEDAMLKAAGWVARGRFFNPANRGYEKEPSVSAAKEAIRP